jgi:hypothetical protein
MGFAAMIEAVIILIVIALGIAVIVSLIPVLVRFETESEGDPVHVWNVMYRESGPKGWHFTAPSLFVLPFTLLAEGSRAYETPEGTFLILAAALVGLVTHTALYRGVSILNATLFKNLSYAVVALLVTTVLGHIGVISGMATIFFGVLLGSSWGTYVLYRRALEIRHNNSLNPDGPDGPRD